MDASRIVKISKYLSYHLRHRPELLGLILARGGWVSVDKLLKACQDNSFPISRHELETVVRQNDKQRFSFDETGTQIRANQGHSIAVDLQLIATTPPDILYHGTIATAGESILSQGLQKMSRHHVHLSADRETAAKVGQRRGKPVIFQVDALAMSQEGYLFYCSDNGVWLVDEVPTIYLKIVT